MSKYSQLPRDTLALLAMRAQKGVAVQDYVNWAVNALVDGFDSPSLSILAGLGYDITSQIEAPDYFLKTVKELALPIPDCELAIGNWQWTNSFYRNLGLSLPDEKTLLSQHLDELAEQIKEGVIDPVAGLDRIYHEVVIVYRLSLWESETLDLEEGWDGIDVREWDDLWSFVHYDENYNEESEPARKSKEIITFANDWLENLEERGICKTAAREPTIIQNEMIEPMREQPNTEKMKPVSVQCFLQKTERIRKIPNIAIETAYVDIKQQIFVSTMVALVCSVVPISVIVYLWTGDDSVHFTSFFDGLWSIVVLGVLTASTVMYAWEINAGISDFTKRYKWIKNAIRAEAEIVDRKAEYNSDAEYREQEWDCDLILKLPETLVDRLSNQLAKAKVSIKVYSKYKDQDTVHIYSSKSDPYCFLIDGE